MSIKSVILDLLFPPRCAFCGSIMDSSCSDVCQSCRKALPYRPEGKVRKTIQGFPCVLTFYYDDMVKTGIRALKFQGKANRAQVFGPFLAQTAAEYLGGEFDAVTFVPLSLRRNFTRGFDQAQLLARAAVKQWDVPVEKTLRKIRNNPPQSSVQTPAQRRANVLGAYKIRRGAAVQGRRFLLIDDVLTTGSTMTACAQTLMAAGAASVVCAALAGGHRNDS